MLRFEPFNTYTSSVMVKSVWLLNLFFAPP
jgi:hypothetical protein